MEVDHVTLRGGSDIAKCPLLPLLIQSQVHFRCCALILSSPLFLIGSKANTAEVVNGNRDGRQCTHRNRRSRSGRSQHNSFSPRLDQPNHLPPVCSLTGPSRGRNLHCWEFPCRGFRGCFGMNFRITNHYTNEPKKKKGSGVTRHTFSASSQFSCVNA